MGTDANGLSPGLRVLRQDDWDKWYDTLIRGFGGVPESAEERDVSTPLHCVLPYLDV